MSQMVNLKVLRITSMEVRSPNKGPIGPTLHNHVDAVPKRLRNLKLQDATKSLYIFSWLSGGAFDLDDLTDLTLTWEFFPMIRHPNEPKFPTEPQVSYHLDPFLSTAGTAVKHLRLEIEALKLESYFNYMRAHFISTGALSRFTALETLDVDSTNHYFKYDAAQLVDIERLLHGVTLANLRKIRITMGLTLNTPDHLPSYKELPSWISLDGLLGSPKFPSLQQLKMIIEVRSSHRNVVGWEDSDSDEEDAPDVDFHPPTVDDVVAMIAEKMPKLTARGLLTFCPAVTSVL